MPTQGVDTHFTGVLDGENTLDVAVLLQQVAVPCHTCCWRMAVAGRTDGHVLLAVWTGRSESVYMCCKSAWEWELCTRHVAAAVSELCVCSGSPNVGLIV